MSRHEITTSSNGETTGSLAYELYISTQASLIDLVWVHPMHRGKKIGTTLIRTCLEQLGLANIQVVYLLVSYGNVQAKSLYRRLGFIELPEVQSGPYAVMGYVLGDKTDPPSGKMCHDNNSGNDPTGNGRAPSDRLVVNGDRCPVLYRKWQELGKSRA